MPDAIGMVLAFYRFVLEHTLSEEERSQILQTIEMFEVITQTQHDDYQSLEILKVAYHKLGKAEEALRTSRRLAEAYFDVGSFSLAMQEDPGLQSYAWNKRIALISPSTLFVTMRTVAAAWRNDMQV